MLGSGPGAVDSEIGADTQRLWEAACRRAAALGEAPLDHIVVRDASGGVVVVHDGSNHIAALTSPDPALGLLIFDLRTCLADACPGEATT
jgi:predicted regulator of Ras-like GTPase activity (Roadblock/LC7/MglB family)